MQDSSSLYTLDKVTITDPTGRFERSYELLGRGAYKEVYKAFDQEEGVEVAWNQLRVNISEKNAVKLLSEIQILQSLKDEHIINFYHSWIEKDPDNNSYAVYFITELMTSGTLKSYIKKTKGPLKPKVYKNWCRQILKGLTYLHSRNPPIIHRDLKCDNIFINGNNGQAKIGDLGLAIFKDKENLSSVLGTPEFMAPELYDEKYDEKVDIYSFGLCVLEMVTKEYPYAECENAAQIFRKVTQGIKPPSLHNSEMDTETREFIELCINFDPTKRPTAEELLASEFLQLPAADQTIPSSATEDDHASPPEVVATASAYILQVSPPNIQFKIIYTPIKGLKNCQEIKFHFNLNSDTVADVVSEMIRENVLPESSRHLIEDKINMALNQVIIPQTRDVAVNGQVPPATSPKIGIEATPERNRVLLKSAVELGRTEIQKEELKEEPDNYDSPMFMAIESPAKPFSPVLIPEESTVVSSSTSPLSLSKSSFSSEKLTSPQMYSQELSMQKSEIGSPKNEIAINPFNQPLTSAQTTEAKAFSERSSPKSPSASESQQYQHHQHITTQKNRQRSKTHDSSFDPSISKHSLTTFKGLLKKSADFGKLLDPEISNLLERQKREIEKLLKDQEEERLCLLEKLKMNDTMNVDEIDKMSDDERRLAEMKRMVTQKTLSPSPTRKYQMRKAIFGHRFEYDGENEESSNSSDSSSERRKEESRDNFTELMNASSFLSPKAMRSVSAAVAASANVCQSAEMTGTSSSANASHPHYNTIHTSSPCKSSSSSKATSKSSFKVPDAIIERQLRELENFRASSCKG